MANPKADFLDYPIAAEGPVTNPKATPENNPVLRGLPLAVGSQIIARSNLVASLFYKNAKFDTIKDLPELDDVPYRFHPCVTPLGDSKMLDLEPELIKPKNLSGGAKYYTAADYHEMYKSGKITPLQVAETLLAAIKRGQNPPSKYADAWVDTHGKESWTLDAARESTERYVAGKPLGVLDGVPIGLKDDIDMKGYVSHLGLEYRPDLPFFKEAEESLWLVKKLVEAGAVVIGKNCMHEMGADTCGLNIVQGTPTNHCNPSYYPGGSSSGGASSVGAGIVPFAVGTDAAGSIRIPASYNGVYGLMTTHHRTGFFELTMASRGPIAASAADLTLAYRIMSQPDPSCPIHSRFGVSKLPEPGAKRVIGIYRDWWKQADDPRILDLCDKAIDYFKTKLGYEVVDISIPLVPEARLALSVMCVAEMTEKARRRTPNPADFLSIVGAANKLLLGVGAQSSAADYLKTNAMRELLMRHLAYLFQEHPGLLIVTPTTPLPGWPRSPSDESWGMSDTNKTVRNMMFLFLSNMTGTPAVTVPVGYVDPEQGEGKLPVGLMAVGEWGAEEQLLQWARESQDYLEGTYEGGRIQPKTWFDVLGEAQK